MIIPREANFLLLISILCTFANQSFAFTNSSDRIHGGRDARNGEFPFVVFVYIGLGTCTGGLLSEAWVLTAAHCLADYDAEPYDTDLIRVAAGEVKREECFPLKWLQLTDSESSNQTGCGTLQIRKAEKAVFHSKFGLNYYWDLLESFINEFDIGAIKVSKVFDLSKPNIGKMSLRAAPWSKSNPLNVECTAIGFGRNETQDNPRVLQATNVTIGKGTEACPCHYSNPYYRSFWPLNAYMALCLQNEERTGGACQGDSGGLLVCDGSAEGIAHIVLAKLCEGGFKCGTTHSVYNYIRPLISWLRRNQVEFTEN